MHSELSILIHAPFEKIFPVASDLERWPDFLPHYIRNEYREKSDLGGVIFMSCKRPPFTLRWISRYEADSAARQMRFEHLWPQTKGMKVVWHFEDRPDGTFIRLTHDFTHPWPVIGPFLAEYVINRFMICHVARQTLGCVKARVEQAP
jgi:ribosome-associated toxin RatA of RatAB toxin-antitoxin module